jgi:FtsZ-interacting cell division protein YlmF
MWSLCDFDAADDGDGSGDEDDEDDSGDSSKEGDQKRKRVSPEDRAELTRQRNREHARSTRLRKKMYVDCLKKELVDLLVRQRQIESGRSKTAASDGTALRVRGTHAGLSWFAPH